MSKILNLFLPTPCVLCQKLGAPLCLACKNMFPSAASPIQMMNVTGFAISDYTTDAAQIVNAVKEKGITSLIPAVADLMSGYWPKGLAAPILVPIPSSPANLKKRGFSHTSLLAREVARRVPAGRYRELLRSDRARADQVGLSPIERQANMEKAFRVDLRGLPNEEVQVVLVDDVITSGASMSEAITSLLDSQVQVASFLVFAEAGGRYSPV